MEQDDGTRKCYYEIMDLELKATDDEIRRQYKRLSLKYHPDKNINDQATAMKKFKEVQAAYAVLNDPQEKAWYDSHRQSILSGDDGNEPDGINIYDFLNPRCYTGFGDDHNGFYAVYNRCFTALAKEEQDLAGETKGKPPKYPTFGTSTSDYDSETNVFYMFWNNYHSKKTFAWKDEYKTTDIPDRYTRRAAERHNQKLRDEARKEFNSLIRELVNYVKERDPRLKAEQDRVIAEQEEKERLREEREFEKRKARAASNQKIWEEAAELEMQREAEKLARGEHLDGTTLEMLYAKEGITKYFHEDDEEEVAREWKCPVCKKTFKTLALWKDHIKSNKHKTKVKQLAAKGVDVEAMIAEANPEPPGKKGDDEAEEKQDAAKEEEQAAAEEEATATKHIDPTPAAAAASDDEDEPATMAPKKNKKNKKGGKQQQAPPPKAPEPESEEDEKPKMSAKEKKAAKYETMHGTKPSGKGKKNKKGFVAPTLSESSSSSSDDSSSEDEAPRKPAGGFGAFGALKKKR